MPKENTVPCWDCMNFKTRVVSKRAIRGDALNPHFKIRKRLKEEDSVRVFYCVKHQTRCEVYVENLNVPKMVVKECFHVNHADSNC